MKTVPYGISDYKLLVEDNYHYIDKTMYLEKLEKADRILVYLRPRRFGKTLFTSMMYYYYDINSESLFDNLFKDTYVYNNPTPYKNKYQVLRFDFSGMTISNDETDLMNRFNEKIYRGIKEFITHYNYSYEIDRNIPPAECLTNFLSFYNSVKRDNKIYLIIDEYDNFTNAILGNYTDLFIKILGNEGFVKAFYAVIKENSGTIIDRVFITGVCSISLDSMTSGFNISTNITNDINFNGMTAVTHDEIKELIKDIPDNDKIYHDLIENYDGYKFNKNGELLFNTTLVMYYLKNYLNNGCPPEELMDKNIISSYEQIKNIIMLKNNNIYPDVIDKIFNDQEISTNLVTNFELHGVVKSSDIVSLLYYFGYLTIKGMEVNPLYDFKIPNKVIEKVYNEYYLSIYEKYNVITEDDYEKDVILEIQKVGKINKLCEYISYLLKRANNRIYINLKEKDIQLFIYAVLSKYTSFNTYLEYPSNNGYIDLMLLKKENSNYNIMIELKYIKKEDYTEELLNKKINDAKVQLNNYISDTRIDNKLLKKYIVIFTGSEYYLEED